MDGGVAASTSQALTTLRRVFARPSSADIIFSEGLASKASRDTLAFSDPTQVCALVREGGERGVCGVWVCVFVRTRVHLHVCVRVCARARPDCKHAQEKQTFLGDTGGVCRREALQQASTKP